ncbi:MAG: hypothetical protein M1820_003937 [Bogoriella megaspora]|nr:MAG: hypothetical protein M1820_003937 [Bogoriella megaspora]
MARIFITGSSDGLGQHAARALIAQGHEVTLHARSSQRAQEALAGAPGASNVLIGDLSSISETKNLAADANKTGRFDVVMHNAGLGMNSPSSKSDSGLAKIFVVNSLAPYILTCLMERPKRLVYVSSGLHSSGDESLRDVGWTSRRRFEGMQAYSDTKLHNVLLAFAVARHWGKGVESNACSPGWVRTKMGGWGAPGDAERGAETQAHLAGAKEDVGSGRYWVNVRPTKAVAAANDVGKQEELLKIYEELSGIALPK